MTILAKRQAFRPELVPVVPETIEEGVLYISIPLAVAVHRCACGCGLDVVTPLGEGGWTLARSGTAFSLSPSIGNWSFPCMSHYFIDNNRVMWAAAGSPQMIAASRQIDNPRAHPARAPSWLDRMATWIQHLWNAVCSLWNR